MHCEQAEMLIPQYIFNELSAEDAAQIAAHLTTCASCTQSCKELKEASSFLESALKAPNEKKFSEEKRQQILAAFSELKPIVEPIELAEAKKEIKQKPSFDFKTFFVSIAAIFFVLVGLSGLVPMFFVPMFRSDGETRSDGDRSVYLGYEDSLMPASESPVDSRKETLKTKNSFFYRGDKAEKYSPESGAHGGRYYPSKSVKDEANGNVEPMVKSIGDSSLSSDVKVLNNSGLKYTIAKVLEDAKQPNRSKSQRKQLEIEESSEKFTAEAPTQDNNFYGVKSSYVPGKYTIPIEEKKQPRTVTTETHDRAFEGPQAPTIGGKNLKSANPAKQISSAKQKELGNKGVGFNDKAEDIGDNNNPVTAESWSITLDSKVPENPSGATKSLVTLSGVRYTAANEIKSDAFLTFGNGNDVTINKDNVSESIKSSSSGKPKEKWGKKPNNAPNSPKASSQNQENEQLGEVVNVVTLDPAEEGEVAAKPMRASEIIIPEEDSRWRPGDEESNGKESWNKTSPGNQAGLKAQSLGEVDINDVSKNDFTKQKAEKIPMQIQRNDLIEKENDQYFKITKKGKKGDSSTNVLTGDAILQGGVNSSKSQSEIVKEQLEEFPKIDFNDDDYLDGAESFDEGYIQKTESKTSNEKKSELAPLSDDMQGGINLWKDNKDPSAPTISSNGASKKRIAKIGRNSNDIPSEAGETSWAFINHDEAIFDKTKSENASESAMNDHKNSEPSKANGIGEDIGGVVVDGEKSVKTVAGRDINLRVFVEKEKKRSEQGQDPKEILEGPSGGNEYFDFEEKIDQPQASEGMMGNIGGGGGNSGKTGKERQREKAMKQKKAAKSGAQILEEMNQKEEISKKNKEIDSLKAEIASMQQQGSVDSARIEQLEKSEEQTVVRKDDVASGDEIIAPEDWNKLANIPETKMNTYSVLDLVEAPKAFAGPDIAPDGKVSVAESKKSELTKKVSEDNLKELIKHKIARDTWDEAKGTSIEVFQGKLIVNHTEEVQKQVEAFLEELKEKAAITEAEQAQEEVVDVVPVKPEPKKIVVNPFVNTSADALSTFSIDTDSASYYVCRQSLLSGVMPHESVVRPEEFINAFDYNYCLTGQKTFAINTDCMQNPFNSSTHILKVGIKGKVLGRDGRKPVHVVLVVDTSGSMAKVSRLPMVKKGIEKLVTNMQPGDRVSLVTYGSDVTLNLEYTPVEDIDQIQNAVESLKTGGSTDLAKGVMVGYQIAATHFKKGAMNQVMICSDGVANVGHLEADKIIKKVEAYKKQGVSFTSIGFGSGDYNDQLLQKLALRGDGFYYYVNNEEDVKRVFEKEIGASFNVIAKDVKLQVAFKENRVLRYRLIGYEAREVKDKDFRNNAVDGGEIISGKSVTAIYELELAKAESAKEFQESLGTVTVRFQNVENNQWEEDAVAITGKIQMVASPKENPYFYLAYCAATFAEIMRKSPYVNPNAIGQIEDCVRRVSEELVLNDQVKDLLKSIQAYEKLMVKDK